MPTETIGQHALQIIQGLMNRVLKLEDQLRLMPCPRPINCATDESVHWCVENGHCGCGNNHALRVKKGAGYDKESDL